MALRSLWSRGRKLNIVASTLQLVAAQPLIRFMGFRIAVCALERACEAMNRFTARFNVRSYIVGDFYRICKAVTNVLTGLDSTFAAPEMSPSLFGPILIRRITCLPSNERLFAEQRIHNFSAGKGPLGVQHLKGKAYP